jgi:hypothetical protein
MAASYPVEVAQADRWLQDPANAGLRGEALFEAVDAQAWDPSVKSLTPFPGILRMMDSHLEWTESLGEAFIANPQAVADAVQDLRHRAMAAGALHSTAHWLVTETDGVITIEPAMPQSVDYPAYDPTAAYGPWPYPDFPPYAFDDIYDGCAVGDFGYCWFDLAIVTPLWGWNHWDWRDRRIDLDQGRFAGLNHGRPPEGGDVWRHEHGHRHGVPYLDPETRARYPAATLSLDTDRAARGFPSGGGGFAPAPTAHSFAAPPRPASPPSFESYGRGADARSQALRGEASRMSPPVYRPQFSAPVFTPRSAPPAASGRVRR